MERQLETYQKIERSIIKKFRKQLWTPFIVAVKGMDRQAILQQFRERIHNSTEKEFRTALDQVHRIAGFRLADIQ